ncbi:tyrosine-protein phosphatase non-receptor type 1 [Eurytemora carolleeae]|uniref:tyrosine-protein phosphatase non-receptor type 1 n=1 Tax=Eurytemora carolleeae TaxID=1294199 RepID=UPI000C774423|nr:tyrosine-protein phosphatase non-receptor type 1 [Eurytemora carolleeae]|eukprot:XP_023349070.1 tyrosine-protein phosphatase non-receptor type 1-like [Eurytemora affinis]
MLDTPKGEVPLPYVNASDIKFNGFKQTYLAVQAPKVKAMPSFWQMVLERKVRIIVMITGLVENKRIKADRYWPEEEDDLIVFEDIKITFLDQSYNGSFFTRHLELEVEGAFLIYKK